jgi:hypothetical protein
MSDRIRYRLYAPRAGRSSLAEWGPFLLALVVGALMLLMLARPILSIPETLPGPRGAHQPDPSAGHATAVSQGSSADKPQ